MEPRKILYIIGLSAFVKNMSTKGVKAQTHLFVTFSRSGLIAQVFFNFSQHDNKPAHIFNQTTRLSQVTHGSCSVFPDACDGVTKYAWIFCDRLPFHLRSESEQTLALALAELNEDRRPFLGPAFRQTTNRSSFHLVEVPAYMSSGSELLGSMSSGFASVKWNTILILS